VERLLPDVIVGSARMNRRRSIISGFATGPASTTAAAHPECGENPTAARCNPMTPRILARRPARAV
jgi:hypothetical protein